MEKQIIKLTKNHTISEFQGIILDIYGLPDDRLFSIHDLLSNQEKFAMRAIKGIRKGDKNKLKDNLTISFSWLMAIANRLHIDLEKVVWKRFPNLCSYCGQKPCACKKIKIKQRVKFPISITQKPLTLDEFQKMFNEIYPGKIRTVTDAGIHLAEETGEVDEAIHVFLGEHKQKQFLAIENEMADWVSCMFAVANSADIDISADLAKKFSHNCHICRQTPCECNFSFVAKYES